jgi:hypothetical protein
MKMRRLFAAALLLAAATLQAGELLWNGNFNIIDSSGDPNGWYVYIENPDKSYFEVHEDFSYDGTPCICLIANEESPGVEVGQSIVFEPNSMPALDFSCVVTTQWYSANNWGDVFVEMEYREPNGTYLAYDSFILLENNMMPAPTTWTAYHHTFTVPSAAGQLTLRLRGADWIKGVFFDDVSLSYAGDTQAKPVYPAIGDTVAWQDPARCGYGPTLNWIAAADATGDHYVYLGTSAAAVAAADTDDPEFLGTVPLTDPNFVLPLSAVEHGVTYYWRVDETIGGGVVKGETIGRFTISRDTDVDSFDYASEAALQAVWGPTVGLSGEAMQIPYDNTAAPYLTEVSADAADLGPCSNDWTFGGNKLLLVNVRGHDDMTDSIYITLESNGGAQSGTVQYPDAGLLNQQSYEWFRYWPIDLQAFADQGVDLTNVTKLTVGIGTRNAPAAGGAGTITVDYIRLSAPLCLTEMIPADMNRDCVVDLLDLANIADNWLSGEVEVTAASPARGPILWYTFNEGIGADVNDLSGFGYHGVISSADSWAGAGSGFDGSNCLDLGNDTWVEVPIAAANIGDPEASPAQQLGGQSTAAFWFKDPGQQDQDSMFFKIGPDTGGRLTAWASATGTIEYAAGWDVLDWGSGNYTNPAYRQDQWVHLAFVKDAAAGRMGIYQNGELMIEMPAGSTASPAPDGVETFFTIGAWRWSGGSGGYLDGLLDDFRVYDYALSQAEVLSLAVEGGAASSPLIQPLITSANIVKDGRVDLADFAEIAARWLKESIYP